jgi:AraC-like DNA-binding protein
MLDSIALAPSRCQARFRRGSDNGAGALKSIDPGDYQRVPSPVGAMPKEFPDGFVIAPHRHERAQLLYASAGTMRVITADGTWVVPPLRALWIPAATEHEIRMCGDVAMRTLYVAPAAAPWLLPRCTVIEVSALLRELILAAMREPIEHQLDGRPGLVMALLLEELRRAETVPLSIPMPRDRRLLALCRALLERPEADASLERWAEQVHASSRTLSRLFQRETGMSFVAWRQQVRLAEALARLALGQPVGVVSRDLGYASASAFTAMFRRALGATPRGYLQRGGPGSSTPAQAA